MKTVRGAALSSFLLLSFLPTGASFAQSDECLLGEIKRGASGDTWTCEIFDDARRGWVSPTNGLDDRARAYVAWARANHLPAGQVATTFFSDATLSQLVRWDDVGDSAMWTGNLLAAESLRYLSTRSPDAQQSVKRLVMTLHSLFAVTGSPAYLARFAVREDDDPRIVGLVDLSRANRHRSSIDGRAYRWIGDTSRDQYQGVVMGLALAYKALDDEALKNLIRQDLTTLAEVLMKKQKYTVRIRWKIGGFTTVTKLKLDLQYVIRNNAVPLEVFIDVLDIDRTRFGGLQEFMPTIMGIPVFRRTGSAIMLTSMFQAALSVTRDAPAWKVSYDRIKTFYEQHANEWLDVADEWSYSNSGGCYPAYFAININFEPVYTMLFLKEDPARYNRIVNDVLLKRLWPVVDDHKQVFFSYIAAASQPTLNASWDAVVSQANGQLAQFPDAPHVDVPNDVSALYPENRSCPGKSTIALDVGHRNPADFLWQRSPFGLSSSGNVGKVFPGIDYLVAYWLGRYQGFLESDAPGTRTAWRRTSLAATGNPAAVQ